MKKEKKYQFEEHHYQAIGKMIQMYSKKHKPHKGKGRPPKLKMEWLKSCQTLAYSSIHLQWSLS